jgi:anti-anti-sigma factor
MDSAALEVLVRARRALEERGGTLKIVKLNDVCRDILLVTRLLNEFQVHDDLHEALRGGAGT